MRIKNERTATSTFYDAETMGDEYSPPGVEFSTNGHARVTKDVGEALIEKFDHIVSAEQDDSTSTDSTDESADSSSDDGDESSDSTTDADE